MKNENIEIVTVRNLDISMIKSGDFIQLKDGTICIVVLHEGDESYMGYGICPWDGSAIQISEMYDEYLNRIDDNTDLDIVSILQTNDSRCIDIHHRKQNKFSKQCKIIVKNYEEDIFYSYLNKILNQ